MNAAGSAFANQGALGSGAAAGAFGEALANPFAQAQAQLQTAQMGATGGALSQLLGLSGSAYGQNLGAAGNLAGQSMQNLNPMYMTNPAWAQQQAQQQGKQQTGNDILQTGLRLPLLGH